MEKSNFRPGGKPMPNGARPSHVHQDEYEGKYKEQAEAISPDEKWGLSQNPVKETPVPWKGMRSVG
jgi:hypothetical protein